MLVKYFQNKSFSENLEPSNIKFSMRSLASLLTYWLFWTSDILLYFLFIIMFTPSPPFFDIKRFTQKNAIFKSNNVKIHKKCENQTEDIPKPEFSKKNLNPGTLKSSQIWIC